MAVRRGREEDGMQLDGEEQEEGEGREGEKSSFHFSTAEVCCCFFLSSSLFPSFAFSMR